MSVDPAVLKLYRQAKIDKIDIREYSPPGPVGNAFMRDRVNWVRFLHGPIGSGKTNVNFFDKLTLASEMPKCTRGDGRFIGNRVHRHLEVRDTYQNLWGTTIKSWWGWFGPDIGTWSGGIGRKAEHQLTFEQPDGSLLYFEIIFQAIQDADVDAALRGIEFTTANMGEADQQSGDVLPYLIGRALQQRFPPKRWFDPGTEYLTGVTGDLNPADPENWIYDVFEDKQPAGHKLYKQPSGRSAQGENRLAISRETYEKMAATNAHRKDWVRRMVDGKKGFSREGEPVYDGYDDDTHCGDQELEPIKGLPLRLGFDQGVRGPAMVVSQWTPEGQLRVIDEFCPGRIGPTGFARGCKILLEKNYHGYAIELATGDPRGFDGSDDEFGDESMFQTVANVMKIIIVPAETNQLDPRLDGVRQLLRYTIRPGVPALLVSKRCKMVRKGFASHYRYKKRRGQEAGTDPKPEKNEFSNPHDALQYIVLMLLGVEGVMRGELMGGRGDSLAGRGNDDDWAQGGTASPDTEFDVWDT
jgi:hypothetical protein